MRIANRSFRHTGKYWEEVGGVVGVGVVFDPLPFDS